MTRKTEHSTPPEISGKEAKEAFNRAVGAEHRDSLSGKSDPLSPDNTLAIVAMVIVFVIPLACCIIAFLKFSPNL